MDTKEELKTQEDHETFVQYLLGLGEELRSKITKLDEEKKKLEEENEQLKEKNTELEVERNKLRGK